jgi:beta-1,4-mannosyltransferase
MLFFGNIRPYKNVPQLLAAFRGLNRQDVQLMIVGQPGGGIDSRQLEQLAGADPRIQLRLEFVDDHDVPLYLGAADLVVLPFDSILNSGSALLALSFNRPILAPRLGSLPEIQHRVGARWLELYEGRLAPQHLEQAMSLPSNENDTADLSAFDWDVICQQTLELYAAMDTAQSEIAAHRTPPLPGSTAK